MEKAALEDFTFWKGYEKVHIPGNWPYSPYEGVTASPCTFQSLALKYGWSYVANILITIQFLVHSKRMSFKFQYQKFEELWIWKYIRNSIFLKIGASISDFWFKGPVLKSQSHLFFFIGKIVVVTEIWTLDSKMQSQLYLPLDHRDKFF